MHDGFFEKSLVLLWHHDEDGAIGVIVNRVAEQSLADIMKAPEGVSLEGARATVALGGPVEGQAGTVLFRGAVEDDDGWNIEGGMAVSRSMDVMLRLLQDDCAFLLCLGYAGWGAGQLDEEIVSGSWLWTEPDPAIILDVPPDERYDRALATLGLTATSVWMQPIDE